MGALTISLVDAGHNRLRYLLQQTTTGTDSGIITTTGAATPDVLTDVLPNQGPICKLAKAFTNGYGAFAAGALSQAQARALWASDWTGADPGNRLTVTARTRLTPNADNGVSGVWLVDVDVDGSGHPVIGASGIGNDVGGSCFLDIEVFGAIGA
jgi:hypothetical protein